MASSVGRAAPWPVIIGALATRGRRERQTEYQRAERTPATTAFVFSGGAARGAIQVGMLRALLDRGITPDLIVGTSVGAFNGAWLAALPTAEGVRQLEDIWNDVRQDDIFAGGPVSVLLHLVRRLPSLYDGDAIHAFLRRVVASTGLASATFECLRVPLVVVATNLTRGRPEMFERGPLIPALLASSAIPAVLPPITIDGEQYVDGGLLDNVGLRVAVERGATRIFVLDTSWDGHADQPASNLEGVVARSIEVVTSFHLQCALERYAEQVALTVLRDDGRAGSGSLDFRATPALMAAGYAIAQEGLAAPHAEAEQTIGRRRATTQVPHAGMVARPTRQRESWWRRAAAVWRTLPAWLAQGARALEAPRPRRAEPLRAPPMPAPEPEAQSAAS
ncbi:MAG TPA: patatin-like phospholipase family protein [Ktedonobacterales bacterium]|jgi:NTE family protein